MEDFNPNTYMQDLQYQYDSGMCSLEDLVASAELLGVELTGIERENKSQGIITIRPYDPSTDERDVNALTNLFYRELYGKPNEPEENDNENTILYNGSTLVAEQNGKVIGFTNYNISPRPEMRLTCYLDNIMVTPRKRNLKIGNIMLNEIAKEAYNADMTSIQLHSSESCRNFYEKNGFYVLNEYEFDPASGLMTMPTILPFNSAPYFNTKSSGFQEPEKHVEIILEHRAMIEEQVNKPDDLDSLFDTFNGPVYEKNNFIKPLREDLPDPSTYRVIHE